MVDARHAHLTGSPGWVRSDQTRAASYDVTNYCVTLRRGNDSDGVV